MAASVLPSPVAISAMLPSCKAIAPAIWTSYGTISHVTGIPTTSHVFPTSAMHAALTNANASGNSLSTVSPFRRRSLNSSVLALKSDSEKRT